MSNLSRRHLLKIAIAAAAAAGCRRKVAELGLEPFSMQTPWVNDSEFIGYFVAINNGLYGGRGLGLKYLSGGPDIIAEGALLSKRADIALTPVETTVNLIVRDGAPLRIVGTQYQKSPLGIVSLESSHIQSPKDLIGKTLAVPPANVLTIEAFFKANGIKKSDVKIVPYQYDPTPLLRGAVDATVDFVTNVPFAIRQAGGTPASFLIFDHGFAVFNDTVVVTLDTLKTRRKEIVAWLRASRQGWIDNFKDPSYYPPQFKDSFFKGTGRTIENEIFFNNAQKPLIESATGIFSMTDAGIAGNIESLAEIGIKATRDMFLSDLSAEI